MVWATKNVSSPAVNAGELQIEARYGFELDDRPSIDERFRQRYIIDYGFNDWYSMRVAGRWNKPQGQGNDFTYSEWEHRLQLFEGAKDGWDGALRITYGHADNRNAPDLLGIDLLGQFSAWGLTHTGNILTTRELGADRGESVLLSLSWKSQVKLDRWKLGGEWFGDLGRANDQHGASRQSHSIGPVINYALTPNVGLEGGYQKGLTDTSSDDLFKFFVKATF